MHKLLERQIRQARKGSASGDVDMEALLRLIDAGYHEADRERQLIARAHRMMIDERDALNAGLSRLHDAVSAMGAGFVIWNEHDRLSLCNERIKELCPSIADLFVPGAEFGTVISREIALGSVLTGAVSSSRWLAERRTRHRDPQGSFEITYADGRVLQVWEEKTREGGVVSLYIDVTDRKRVEGDLVRAKEDAESANLAKSVFLANMSHELRTPLNAVIGFSEMIASGILGERLSAKHVEYLVDIRIAGRHLLQIIDDVLDISRIEAGHYELNEEWFAISGHIETVLRLIQPRADHAKIVLDWTPRADDPSLFADVRAFRQVLLNLLSNAVKFTPAGGRVTVDTAIDPDGSICVSVTDTGIGIAAANIPLVLEPFGQVEGSYARKHGGVGLGLPLSKRLVELHGGRLSLASELGRGTTASFDFPGDRCAYGNLIRAGHRK